VRIILNTYVQRVVEIQMFLYSIRPYLINLVMCHSRILTFLKALQILTTVHQSV